MGWPTKRIHAWWLIRNSLREYTESFKYSRCLFVFIYTCTLYVCVFWFNRVLVRNCMLKYEQRKWKFIILLFLISFSLFQQKMGRLYVLSYTRALQHSQPQTLSDPGFRYKVPRQRMLYSQFCLLLWNVALVQTENCTLTFSSSVYHFYCLYIFFLYIHIYIYMSALTESKYPLMWPWMDLNVKTRTLKHGVFWV